MQKAANFLRGSVRLEAEGPYPERFFNICAAWGIRFWGVERVDETTVRVTVPRSQARRAQQLGPRCLCEVRRTGAQGAPSLLLKLSTRYGMLLGLALSLAAVLVLSRFVLVIDITGNTNLSDGEILAELREAGLYPGVYGPGVDARAISNRMLLEMEDLGFLSVNLRGVRAEVVVRESDPIPELEPVGEKIDLVAAKGGTVLEVLDLAGTPLVEPGDVVEPGSPLVSGTVTLWRADDPTVALGSYDVLAKGTVWAEVAEELSASAPLTALEKAYTGKTETQYGVVLFGKQFKISPKLFLPFTYYDKIEETKTFTLGDGLEMPFSLVIRRYAEYEPQPAQLVQSLVEQRLRSVLEQQLEQAAGEGGMCLRSEWNTSVEDGVLTVSVSAVCREQIAISETKE